MAQPQDAVRDFSYQFQVTLDGSGYGYLRVAPVGRRWKITYAAVSCSTNVLEAKVRVYLRQIGGIQIDTTDMGSTGDVSDTVIPLEDGQPVFYEWSEGDPGTVASLTVSGFESVNGGGFSAI